MGGGSAFHSLPSKKIHTIPLFLPLGVHLLLNSLLVDLQPRVVYDPSSVLRLIPSLFEPYFQLHEDPRRAQRAVDRFQRVAFVPRSVRLAELRKHGSGVIDDLVERERALFFS